MHPTGTKMIKMERLGPISVHYGKKLAENYWKPEQYAHKTTGPNHLLSDFYLSSPINF